MAYPYPFDPTGEAATNLVTAESHVISPPADTEYYFVVPFFAPFFQDSLVITHYPSGVQLVEGVDFALGYKFIQASISCAKPIFGAIVIYDRELSGTLDVQYQTLGDQWAIDETQATALLDTALVDPRITTWEEVVSIPADFPVIEQDWQLNDPVGEPELIAAIDAIRLAIATGQSEYNDMMWAASQHSMALHQGSRWYKHQIYTQTHNGTDWVAGTAGSVVSVAATSVLGVKKIAFVDDAGNVHSSVDDGLTWKQAIESDAITASLICYGAGNYVVIGAAGAGAATLDPDTNDLIVDNAVTFPASINRVKHLGGQFIAIGANGHISTSNDGLTWTTRTSGTVEELFDVAYGNDRYVVVGANGTLLTSADGVTWSVPTAVPPTGAGPDIGIAYGNSIFVAFNGADIYISTDGTTWSPVASTALSDIAPTDITFGRDYRGLGIFVIAGASDIQISIDGSHWIVAYSDITSTIGVLEHSDDRLFIGEAAELLHRAMILPLQDDAGTSYIQMAYLA